MGFEASGLGFRMPGLDFAECSGLFWASGFQV